MLAICGGDWGCAGCRISGDVMGGGLSVQLLMREEIVGRGFFFRLRDDAFNCVKNQRVVLMISYLFIVDILSLFSLE
ncbi:hypothetical protein [Bartonella sp. AP88HLJMH]|uniref:hypothetical protein n=1 Tax=Bartonella sp. AP88HLJMH TaxID=3243505 RepID=UPI0035D07C4D